MPLKTTKRISGRTITAVANRALEQWARNVRHDGDDLGYPHLSPEQKMVVPHGPALEELSNEEQLILGYMASLPNRDPMMLKVGKLHFLERDWWYGECRRKGYWLKPERGRDIRQAPEKMRFTILKYTPYAKWVKKLRDKGFRHNRVGHRPGRLVLGDGETVKPEKPNNEIWMEYVQESHGIKKSEYYNHLSTLRRRIYYLLN